MRPNARAVPMLAATAAATMLLVAFALGRPAWSWPSQAEVSARLRDAAAVSRQAAERSARWIEAGYRRRPTLMLGLAGALALPLLAGVGLILYRRPALTVEAPAEAGTMTCGRHARLEIDGGRVIEVPTGRHLLQIGRQVDNDVCLDDDSVHRYHAVIERSYEHGFLVVDISGPEGNGVVLNGQRLTSAALADGDTLEIGRARIRFVAAA